MKLLTLARDLKRRKTRERRGLFVAEGIRTVEELLASRLTIEGALVNEELGESRRGAALRDALASRARELQHVTSREFASAAGTESPQGVLAIAHVPPASLESLAVGTTTRVLVLDAIQDPGNTGTLLRTAAALGVDATLALPGTVDLWNSKVVRSAMGALFRRPALITTWEELDTFLVRNGIELWGADTDGEPLGAALPASPLALAVGNEGAGLSPAMRSRVTHRVAIRIAPDIESLNVAVAAGIILHHLRP